MQASSQPTSDSVRQRGRRHLSGNGSLTRRRTRLHGGQAKRPKILTQRSKASRRGLLTRPRPLMATRSRARLFSPNQVDENKCIPRAQAEPTGSTPPREISVRSGHKSVDRWSEHGGTPGPRRRTAPCCGRAHLTGFDLVENSRWASRSRLKRPVRIHGLVGPPAIKCHVRRRYDTRSRVPCPPSPRGGANTRPRRAVPDAQTGGVFAAASVLCRQIRLSAS
jgi:hypothetical protein